MSERFDAVVIGSGPAGAAAAGRLNDQRLRTALIERELVGGECASWACIPSKTWRPPGTFQETPLGSITKRERPIAEHV